ncbi:MAG: hybrid sensor histidine kinase/response regulator [Cyanobacteriota bacterium]|nr:hybrid sensor histidine kinase/response regulator [Cyanobacteriota bacterium]
MLENTVKILLIEDNLAEARLLDEVLKGFKLDRFRLTWVKRLQEALARLREEHFDIILLDLTLPDSQGLASLPLLMQQAPTLPIVVLTNTNDDALAIEAVRYGAQDFLVKRFVNVDVLVRSLQYAIERKRAAVALREENEALEMQVRERTAELLKAQELNQLKSEFVAMLSHDFRNPLTTILASAGLLQDGNGKLSEERKRAICQRIRAASYNMAHLLDEVLLIGRADAGKLECQTALVDLEFFCRQLLEELQLAADQKNLSLGFISQDCLLKVSLDDRLLRHILLNLLTNAIKYSPDGGTVRLELKQSDKYATFRVCDRGIGIPESECDKIFSPFYRASNVDRISGNGLGLAMVKRCVEAHCGEIEVESKEGVGTVFTVMLPIVDRVAVNGNAN